MSTRIVILGGGFGGVSTADALTKTLRGQGRLREPNGTGGDVEVVLVNRENYFVFQPLLPTVLPATIHTTHAVVPLRRMLSGVNVEVAVVEEIDVEARCVQLRRRHSAQRIGLRYDHLVLALGSVTDFNAVEGMAEHAVGLRSLGDAIYLRNHALAMLEEADLETDAERQKQLLTFVVVGGGSTGVEVAAELNELVRHAARSFRERRLRPRVVVVHSRARLLPTFGQRLASHATRKAREIGLRLILGRRITRVDDRSVELDNGTSISAATVISTVGNAPHPVVSRLPTAMDDRGWLQAQATLAVPHLRNLWAIGDCASIPDPRNGEAVPATAQHAVRQGAHVASNILRALDGQAPLPYDYRSKGMLVSLGTLKGVGSLLGVRLSGAPAWFLWRGYYLSQLPTLDRQFRVGLDWLLGLFLPRDIVQIDVRRSVNRPNRPNREEGAGEPILKLPADIR